MTVALGTGEALHERLADLGQRLADALPLLGFSWREVEERERIDSLLLENRAWLAAGAAALPFQDLVELADLCGGALEVQFRIDELVALAVGPGTTAPDLEAFRRRVQGIERLTVVLTLKKWRLLAAWGVQAPHTVVKLFLRHEALARALRVPLKDLEDELFAESDGSVKLLILVADRPISLDGSYLAVVGERSDWRRYLPTAPPDPAPVRAMLDEAVRSLHWISFGLSRLTPLQLEAGWTDGTPDGPWN
ncbi:MAG TPA: hypothetical protein VMW27_01690, partial [Thermoanaerobaculia bacterium]|nr:hypothetical protein [Thermoanaerobaculia bacterium]